MLHFLCFTATVLLSMTTFLVHNLSNLDDLSSTMSVALLYGRGSFWRMLTHKFARNTIKGFLTWILFPLWILSLIKGRLKHTCHVCYPLALQLFGASLGPVLPILNPLLYFCTVSLTIVTYLSLTVMQILIRSKLPRPRRRPFLIPSLHPSYYRSIQSPLGRLVSVPKERMDLTSYMTFKSWTGFLRKNGSHPANLLAQLHRIGRNAIIMLAVLNLCSAKALQPNISHAYSSIRAAPSSAVQAAFSAPGAAYSCFSTLHNTILEACPVPQNAHIILLSEGDFDWEKLDHNE